MSARVQPSPVDVAREHWGDPMPDWIEVLARRCDDTSQIKVGVHLERSPSLISRVLRRNYPGDMAAFEELVRGAYMGSSVRCPVLGELPSNECQKWRRRAKNYASVNPTWVRMFRACNRCPLNENPNPKET